MRLIPFILGTVAIPGKFSIFPNSSLTKFIGEVNIATYMIFPDIPQRKRQ